MEDLNETTEYPIATDQLAKGSIVSVETIERAFGVKRETDAYRLALLRAKSYIARRLSDRGEVVTIVERKHELVILTDEEASKYNDEQFAIGLRSSARAHVRNMHVDRGKLSAETIPLHDRRLVTEGRILGAIRSERAIMVAEHRRQTPILPGAKKRK